MLPIASYGLLSDCNSAALVGTDGSIDWLCWPRFDSDSVFARILDVGAGHWSIRPVGEWESRRRYLPGTLVLETEFECAEGRVRLTDALRFGLGERGHRIGLDVPHELVRVITCLSGRAEIDLDFAPSPEYGLGRPLLRRTETGVVTAGGPTRLALSYDAPLRVEDSRVEGSFELGEGETRRFALRWGPPERGNPVAIPPAEVAAALEDTVEAWRSWEGEHDIYEGPHRDLIGLSLRVLKGLTYRPTGAVVAAPTTSLPEQIGGERNWDYRYSWIRDASMTLDALWIGTCSDEVEHFVSWMVGAAGGHVHPERPLQILYGVGGEQDLAERTLPHLRGHRDSRPVRVGNGAWNQTQLDVYGEFLDAYCRYAERLDVPDEHLAHFLADVAAAAAARWRERGSGIWEARAEPRHYLSGRLYCWVALDRAVRLADRIGAPGKRQAWATERDRVREAILSQGWSETKEAFTQAFGHDDLDAVALLIPLLGFLPASDPRVRTTIDAVERELTEDGLLRRYRSEDGLEGGEGAFLICSFWLASSLARAGERDRAEAVFERVVGFANDLGLLAEEADARTGELLGNFPQAFSHVGLIAAAAELDRPTAVGG